MAFDQSTRNRLARFVGDARSLLSEEFTRQLQNDYGLDPENGTVTEVEKLTALDDSRRETARILRETLEYYLAGKADDKKNRQETLQRIVREQAFTVLNRLCALRMAESRGIMIESIAQGYQSKGFQLYARLAGSGLGETGDAYRTYLFSLFDEFAVDLAALFDRFNPQGRLFPRETALLKALELINDPEIDTLWAEDETIGWIYQYFNSKEERKAMRDASQAPRNSRELAVRNQFFTPRYVVEFLTDNTLGRIWYEMTQGETTLKDSCQYLVRRPTEIFLKEGEDAPVQESDENLSQEELLRQPVYIPHRPLKDPREIKMLDPACGSMHFGLYAFDLFERIYAEAWDLEELLGEDALWRLADLDSLHKTYADRESFLRDVPRLIIERNIHGVDIDPRAVQIAGLSLWLRAQKSWQAQGVKPNDRPQIRRSNIVCAEPMPGDREMLDEFLSTLKEDRLEALMRQAMHVPAGAKVRATKAMAAALGKLVRTIWQEMELAGEAGSLLKIEETLREAIAEARKESEEKSPLFQTIEFGAGEENLGFWDQAETLTLTALQNYAEQAAEGQSYRRHLFAGDAKHGFAFIDICKKHYDIVLMNPPFGEVGEKNIDYLNAKYPTWNKNILCAFIERQLQTANSDGFVASVIDRSLLNKATYDDFRKSVLLHNNHLVEVLDLGWGVLDANVEVASCITSGINDGKTICVDIRDVDLANKEEELISCKVNFSHSNRIYCSSTKGFAAFPNSAIVYDLPNGLLLTFSRYKNIKSLGLNSYIGHQLQSERHFRNFWEISLSEVLSPENTYCHFYNGGEYSRFTLPPREIVWFGKFANLSSEDFPSYSYRIQNKNKHFAKGVGYGKRGDYLDAHLIPQGVLFSVEGQVLPEKNYTLSLFLVGLYSSTLTSRLLNTYAGQHKTTGYVSMLPCPNHIQIQIQEIADFVQKGIEIKRSIYTRDETNLLFIDPTFGLDTEKTFRFSSFAENVILKTNQDLEDLNRIIETIDKLIYTYYEIEDVQSLSDLNSYALRLPKETLGILEYEANTRVAQITHQVLSYFLGCIFGRWDIRFFTGSINAPSLPHPFETLPSFPVGMLKNTNGHPVKSGDLPLGYPLTIQWNGILVDDDSHFENIEKQIQKVMREIWGGEVEALDSELCNILGVNSLREYFQKNSLFFNDHLSFYTKSRRQAPIYWQLSTPSNSYSLWLYYHRLNDQTLFTCVNDFVDPKIQQVGEEAKNLRQKKSRSSVEERELERLTDFERELKDFRDELLRVAKFWKPNLNDGVQITAAPLWKLFQHRPWQKKLKETWEKLEAGEYDWSHLAYSVWTDRVREKCKSDKSLAIAHDLEHLYVESDKPIKKSRKSKVVSPELFENE